MPCGREEGGRRTEMEMEEESVMLDFEMVLDVRSIWWCQVTCDENWPLVGRERTCVSQDSRHIHTASAK